MINLLYAKILLATFYISAVLCVSRFLKGGIFTCEDCVMEISHSRDDIAKNEQRWKSEQKKSLLFTQHERESSYTSKAIYTIICMTPRMYFNQITCVKKATLSTTKNDEKH